MSRLREWSLDWLDRSNTQPSDRKIEDPLTLLQRLFAALAGTVAILSSPAISVLVPNLNANAAVVLRVLIALGTLVAVHYVVTAKETVETVSGFTSQTARKYRFSNTERLLARGIVGLAILIWSLNFIPPPTKPRDCSVTAVVRLSEQLDGTARPLFVSLTAGGERRYPVEADRPVAMQVPSEHLSRWLVTLLWSDGSRSDFGAFSGCPAAESRESGDARAEITLTDR